MYKVAVKRGFAAQHYLVGGDWGDENEIHTHQYQVELQLEGTDLDQHGFLVDIVGIENNLEKLASAYSDKILNNLPEFHGLNPSIEHFARIICLGLDSQIKAPNITTIIVIVWENEIAWASYRHER